MHVLRAWDQFLPKLQTKPRLLLLCDYDGTLVPIVSRPDRTHLSEPRYRVLEALIRQRQVRLGIVSGRSISDVRKLVPLTGLLCAGNHGCEISGTGLHYVHPKARKVAPLLKRLGEELRQALKPIPGALVEAKGLSLSVHWRLVSSGNVVRFEQLVKAVLSPWIKKKALQVTYGKRVTEVRAPVAWDKGRAVEWIVRHLKQASEYQVLYLGDDRTDEDAFRSVNRLKGLSIFVGSRNRKTKAHWRLEDVRQVYSVLRKIRKHYSA